MRCARSPHEIHVHPSAPEGWEGGSQEKGMLLGLACSVKGVSRARGHGWGEILGVEGRALPGKALGA